MIRFHHFINPGLLVLQISHALKRFGMKPRSGCSNTHRLSDRVPEVSGAAAGAFVIEVQTENLSQKTSSQQLLVTVGLDMRMKQKLAAQVKTISLIA